MAEVPREAIDRLLEAWRGEIEAGTVYELIARRERDPTRAEILRRMAEAEGGHRRRLEARMRELGVPVPDASTVRISPWLRLQARVAPLDRLLAAREAAESDEVDDLYLRPTGDERTDELLREIRRGGRRRLGAVDGDRRLPRGALRARGCGRERRAGATGDRRAPGRGAGGAVALLPAQGTRRGHGRRAREGAVAGPGGAAAPVDG